MNYRHTLIGIFFFGLIFSGLNAQFQRGQFSIYEPGIGEKGALALHLNGSGFFHNNEFFGELEGYTLTGFYFQPVVGYHFTESFSIRAGLHSLKYHGQENFKQLLPFFSLIYARDAFRITAGSYNTGANLRLPEALYRFENQFTNLVGNGIHLQAGNDILKGQVWLDWRSFIEEGDTTQEAFIFGHRGEITLLERERYSIRLPLFILVSHFGGQINNNNDPVVTSANLGTGLEWHYEPLDSRLERLSLLGHYYYSTKEEGHGFYSLLSAKSGIFEAGAGYYMSNDFRGILGEPLLFPLTDGESEKTKSPRFMLFKAGLGKSIGSHSNIALRFEGYYDSRNGEFQYTYGLYFQLNEWLSLIKPR